MSNNNFHYRIIKARVAETLIKELFLSCGCNVFDYGMERTLPAILGKIKNLKETTAKQIRSMPDFVIQNIEKGVLFYVEVKYRKNGKFGINDLIKDYPYKNAYFIIVSKQNIQAISFTDLEKGNTLPNKSFNSEDFNQFDLNKLHVDKYKKYASAFFDGIE